MFIVTTYLILYFIFSKDTFTHITLLLEYKNP